MTVAEVRAVATGLRVAIAISVAVLYARRSLKFRKELVRLRCSIDATDANLAEIRERRAPKLERDHVIVAERARRELDGIDLLALADYLQLKPVPPKAKRNVKR